MDSGRTIVADLYLHDTNIQFILRWYGFSSVLTVLVVLLGKYSFDGLADYLTFIELLVFQVLTALTSILLMNVFSVISNFIPCQRLYKGGCPGLSRICAVLFRSFLTLVCLGIRPVCSLYAMEERNITASAYFAFILDRVTYKSVSQSLVKLKS
jgi:hypothetical protein